LKFWFYYVYKNYRYLEIDLIAYNDEHIAYIECKWRNKPTGSKTLDLLKSKSRIIGSPPKPLYIIFGKSGCTQSLRESDVRCFDQ
jgi:predicted AAA+ superfamily ATPase